MGACCKSQKQPQPVKSGPIDDNNSEYNHIKVPKHVQDVQAKLEFLTSIEVSRLLRTQNYETSKFVQLISHIQINNENIILFLQLLKSKYKNKYLYEIGYINDERVRHKVLQLCELIQKFMTDLLHLNLLLLIQEYINYCVQVRLMLFICIQQQLVIYVTHIVLFYIEDNKQLKKWWRSDPFLDELKKALEIPTSSVISEEDKSKEIIEVLLKISTLQIQKVSPNEINPFDIHQRIAKNATHFLVTLYDNALENIEMLNQQRNIGLIGQQMSKYIVN